MTSLARFPAAGAMGSFFDDKDWANTRIGPPDTWSARLVGYVDMMLRMATGAIIFWGPDQVQLYNIHYSDIMGPRHPRYLGEPYRDCWPDTFEIIDPMMRRVMDGGETIEVTNALIPVTRYGFTEETYFTFSFVPLLGDDNTIDGFIQYIAETSRTVFAERRLVILRALAPRVELVGEALHEWLSAFRSNPLDMPFTAIWVNDEHGASGLPTLNGVDAVPEHVQRVAAEVTTTGAPVMIDNLLEAANWAPVCHWPEPVMAAIVLPLRRTDAEPCLGAIAFGISPRLRFDLTYREFLEGATRALASNLAFEREARAKDQLAEELRSRADSLAELDRAKTLFFSNVSHELRTPLTLMLGPVEDALDDRIEPLAAVQRERLELVERSGTRLFKLVNTLLDFSRIEAGRSAVQLERVDLAELTAGLAGSFRTIVERAGLKLEVDCDRGIAPIWVDREMWEKVVLNLLSNAFKFTFDGGIRVRLVATGDVVELSISDSGTGIAENELANLFDRFHRVEGARGRSFEGSGIGLALVQELVKLLAGTIRVTSTLGVGTTFIVTLPAGSRASESAATSSTRTPRDPNATAVAFVREAEGWSGDALPSLSPRTEIERDISSTAPSEGRPRILLADDNADMRAYVRRLLEPRYTVVAVTNGTEAVAALDNQVPDLVLTDVMMPGLDGFGVLRAVKSSPRTRLVPVILLSARAGEESRVEGMEAGADDYLVKPFAAKELLARVTARLDIAALQRTMTDELELRVDERTAQLAEANRELESFSYSVSHDLRAPLRHILGFAQLLDKAAHDALDDKAQGYLTRIADAAGRGGKLVDDLLAFSRMAKTDLHKHRIDLGRIVADIRNELAPDQEGRDMTWKVGELPEVHGDHALIRMVMKNLLANALKYTRHATHAVIEVGARARERDIEVWVSDNGVGFDMRYIGKLFGVFQRLHSAEEFEGTGIGLALVRRIISRHGGTTSAVGAVGKGATITFTLPRPRRD